MDSNDRKRKHDDTLDLENIIEKQTINCQHLTDNVDKSTTAHAKIPFIDQIQDISHTYVVNECQESEGDTEVDLHKRYINCKKNPGHKKFIPIKEFTIKHLPDGQHDTDLYKLIKAVADLTVRIGVKMVSPHRPEFFPNTKFQYPFYNKGGNVNTRSGTGEINVFKFIDGCGYDITGDRKNSFENREWEDCFGVNYKTCPCEKCQHSDNPNNVWWVILVNTAAHVVFDDIEARHTSCRLFFDDQKSQRVILDKVSGVGVNIEGDRCVLKYETCDDTLGDKLYKMVAHWNDLCIKVHSKYKMRRFTDKLNFIVSHPHGCPKQVSVGKWVEMIKVNELSKDLDVETTKFTYTTSTCPGSSGARVFCLGLVLTHYHYGALKSGLNLSCVGVSISSDFNSTK